MSERRKPYPFHEIEPKWQQVWDANRSFHVANPGEPAFDPDRPKFYILDMFPYPSGAGLHVGHPEGYTATDIVARYKRMRGFNVLHPMGWDAFGLPAEQYAIKTGQHPAITTRENVAKFKSQLKRIGFSYDWDREINTTDPRYFRWTQWIFLQIYNSWFNPETRRAEPISTYAGVDPDGVRLAYVAKVPVNWCADLGTVLANEEVIDGKSEVGGFPVVRRPMRQWMLRITAFAERLIDELEGLEWPGSIKALQRNWIGRSEGAEVLFEVAQASSLQPDAGSKLEARATIAVFTTRPDTLYGATYMVLAPESPLVDAVTTDEQRKAVENYRAEIGSKSDLERTELTKDKTGVFTGGFAINPVNEERIPIWIADYVLMTYGTGAIMAVPGHDERDFEFAQKYQLPIREVVADAKESGFSTRRVTNPVSVEEGFFAPHEPVEVHHRNLPHWQQTESVYFLTWRLADSIPQAKLSELRDDQGRWRAAHPEPWSAAEEEEFHERFTDRLDEWLDQGMGSCLLADASHAQVVVDALRFFDGERCELQAYCVMPNHVHVLVRLNAGEKLPNLIHSWKRHTAREINQRLGREGRLWQEEYYDRLVRSWEHFGNLKRYIAANPHKAGLAAERLPVWVAGTEGGFSTRHGVENPVSLFSGEGFAVNSPLIDGLPTDAAKQRITEWLEEHGLGRGTINYKLRDWLFSRQRYWGEPFPIVWRDGRHEALPESELPLEPPPLEDFKPTGTGEPPLAKAKDWIRFSDGATRETNTMPQWAGSCWYYLRFCDPENDQRFVGEEAERYWMGAKVSGFGVQGSVPSEIGTLNPKTSPGGVDLYVGGTEHAVLHLLYARFWHKVLFDLDYLSKPEPFQRLVNQGIILGGDGQKMSKSRGNVVNPDDVIDEYGADAFRCYEMFMGPLEQMKPWSMKGVEGVSRFLARVWRLIMEENQAGEWVLSAMVADAPAEKAQLKVLHATIKKVGEDIETLSFNTAISQMMILVNSLTNAPVRSLAALRTLLVLLNPFAPHVTSELWETLHQNFGGTTHDITAQCWPDYDERLLIEDELEIVVQVNGKVRDKIVVALAATDTEVEAAAFASSKVQEHIAGKTIRKVVVVPGKLVNIVAT